MYIPVWRRCSSGGSNGCDESDLFGDEKQTKRALDRDIEGVGTLPGCQIVQDHHGSTLLERDRDHAGLAKVQTPGE